MSSLKLSHIGEPLVAAMIDKSSAVKNLLLNDTTGHGNCAVECEAPLDRWNGRIFDGAHRVDVGIFDLRRRTCKAIELKLGKTRMGATEFARRFVQPCGASHNDTRVKGSVISILERHLADSVHAPIELVRNKVTFTLERNWILVVRQSVLSSWSTSGPPTSPNCRTLAIEDLIEALGGKCCFNTLVAELVNGDHFDHWFGAEQTD